MIKGPPEFPKKSWRPPWIFSAASHLYLWSEKSPPENTKAMESAPLNLWRHFLSPPENEKAILMPPWILRRKTERRIHSKTAIFNRSIQGGLCVNLRKPCVQVIFKTPRAIFNQQQWSTAFLSIWRLMKFRILPRGLIMKSKLAQFPRRWLKPIVGPFWGARVSPAEFISLPLRYFYHHIHLTQFANHQLDGSNFSSSIEQLQIWQNLPYS